MTGVILGSAVGLALLAMMLLFVLMDEGNRDDDDGDE